MKPQETDPTNSGNPHPSEPISQQQYEPFATHEDPRGTFYAVDFDGQIVGGLLRGQANAFTRLYINRKRAPRKFVKGDVIFGRRVNESDEELRERIDKTEQRMQEAKPPHWTIEGIIVENHGVPFYRLQVQEEEIIPANSDTPASPIEQPTTITGIIGDSEVITGDILSDPLVSRETTESPLNIFKRDERELRAQGGPFVARALIHTVGIQENHGSVTTDPIEYLETTYGRNRLGDLFARVLLESGVDYPSPQDFSLRHITKAIEDTWKIADEWRTTNQKPELLGLHRDIIQGLRDYLRAPGFKKTLEQVQEIVAEHFNPNSQIPDIARERQTRMDSRRFDERPKKSQRRRH